MTNNIIKYKENSIIAHNIPDDDDLEKHMKNHKIEFFSVQTTHKRVNSYKNDIELFNEESWLYEIDKSIILQPDKNCEGCYECTYGFCFKEI